MLDPTVWDTKILEGEEEVRKPMDDLESIRLSEVYEYREYKEPEPEPEGEEEVEEGVTTEVSEAQEEGEEGEEQEETFGTLGKEDTVSPKTSKASFREQLEADIQEQLVESMKVLVTVTNHSFYFS
ncbi:hypothetical protein J6590_106668 [Homalodisca vitripennis]|nr:hypothetical protein J6590_106668 [Homalodisca vitripennis]